MLRYRSYAFRVKAKTVRLPSLDLTAASLVTATATATVLLRLIVPERDNALRGAEGWP
ncbi:MAG: hypothetical protein WCL08_10095 [Verrucomicrobiota bacterium]